MGIHMAEARIDLGRLRNNIEIVKKHLGKVKVLFPVKADGYGHGAVGISRLSEEAAVDYLGVANLLEALELRQAGIHIPVLILSASRPELARELVEADVTVNVSTLEMAKALEQAAARAKKTVKAHVKVDTGMGRNGVLAEKAYDFVHSLHDCPHIEVEGIFSHFSVSYTEEPSDQEYTRQQIHIFNQLLKELERAKKLPPLRHIANSSALIQYENEVTTGYYNMVRPGVLLYGYPEVSRPWTQGIRPPMTLVTWVVCVKEMPPGRYIGYGRKYRTDSQRQIATLPVGYADGINPKLACHQGQVVIQGEYAPLVGGISMDQLTVDVTHIPNVKIGDEVELISDALPAEEIARRTGARFTEIVLTALSRRVARVYIS
ncbi:MAG: alanine racemase [Candidatus Fraserbacteria bacterium RBG_16_55_9]|uniref:Alanine racemase n=1 Tax=Fraserbacteria sp. (strain RBG_16_55_9) TaxID=1817864 RepID=A0A1F5UVR5_FRAXR|nr:MAG: alanine racemase [Candidatus Fraserbacteria bacterium RBG_16_55_9]